MRITSDVKIILVSGPIASGKSTLADLLSLRFRAHVVKTRDMLQKAPSASTPALQDEGDRLDEETSGRWVLEGLIKAEAKADDKDSSGVFVVDAVRTEDQISAIRQGYQRVIHVHLTAGERTLESRYNRRRTGRATYAKVKANKTESDVGLLRGVADSTIDTDRCTPDDVMVRAAAHARLYGEYGYVDIIVGGQYGSEGKGQVAAHLAKEYDLLVRVGGPNAGHKVPKPKYTYHHLPSGTQSSYAKLLLGPGAVINPARLLKEIAECKVTKDRLSIDPQAMIIEESDKKGEEKDLVDRICSTGSGVGYATARKIQRGSDVKLAQDVDELKPFIKKASQVIDETLANGGRIMLEGAQGSKLSIHHGNYPHVTSRETNAAGCLADAGIPPGLVRRVVMVVRTYPIRVGDVGKTTSGRLNTEITAEIISARSGKPVEKIKDTEIGSTTGRPRKMGEFEWDSIRDAAFLNRPTDIALTFTDYLSADNSEARRFEQLTERTIEMIGEIECVTGARVSMIVTGFGPRSIIDRRAW